MRRAQDPCRRASDELSADHVRILVGEMSVVAKRLARALLAGASATGDPEALRELADLAGSALSQLERVASALRAPGDEVSAD